MSFFWICACVSDHMGFFFFLSLIYIFYLSDWLTVPGKVKQLYMYTYIIFQITFLYGYYKIRPQFPAPYDKPLWVFEMTPSVLLWPSQHTSEVLCSLRNCYIDSATADSQGSALGTWQPFDFRSWKNSTLGSRPTVPAFEHAEAQWLAGVEP